MIEKRDIEEGWKKRREEGWKKRREEGICRRRKTALEIPEKETTIEKEHKGKRTEGGDCPGGPVDKSLHFHCRGHGFDSWLGN